MDLSRKIRQRVHNVIDAWLENKGIALDPTTREHMQIRIDEEIDSALCQWRETKRQQNAAEWAARDLIR